MKDHAVTDTKTEHTICLDLIQLPNGNWLDPSQISVVRHNPRPMVVAWPQTTAHDSVSVSLRDGWTETISFESKDEAIACRDDLAAKVNAARMTARAIAAKEG